MSDMVKLVSPEVLARAALTGEEIDVLVKVPVEAFAAAWKCLHPILDDGSPALEAWYIEQGRSVEELSLLCALFLQVTGELPMDARHYLTWLEKTGLASNLDEFAKSRTMRTVQHRNAHCREPHESFLKDKNWFDVASAAVQVFDRRELGNMVDCITEWCLEQEHGLEAY